MKVKKSPSARVTRSGAHCKDSGFIGVIKEKSIHLAKAWDQQQKAIAASLGQISFTAKIVGVLVVLVIGAFAVGTLVKQQIAVNEKQAVLDELDRRIAAQKLANAEMEAKLDGDPDDYIEYYARENLDMVKPGERVFINTAGE